MRSSLNIICHYDNNIKYVVLRLYKTKSTIVISVIITEALYYLLKL